jgi:hypothetical protein
MTPEPRIAHIVPCPQCGRQNRIPAHSTTADVLCSACHAPLESESPAPERQPRELDPKTDKASRLFRFLKELVELRGRAVRTLDRYDSVLWLHEVPQHPLCRRIDWSAGTQEETSEVWLEVEKPTLTVPPAVPVSLMPWVDSEKLKDSSNGAPILRERIPVGAAASESREGEDPRFLLLNDHPEITASWHR